MITGVRLCGCAGVGVLVVLVVLIVSWFGMDGAHTKQREEYECVGGSATAMRRRVGDRYCSIVAIIAQHCVGEDLKG